MNKLIAHTEAIKNYSKQKDIMTFKIKYKAKNWNVDPGFGI